MQLGKKYCKESAAFLKEIKKQYLTVLKEELPFSGFNILPDLVYIHAAVFKQIRPFKHACTWNMLKVHEGEDVTHNKEEKSFIYWLLVYWLAISNIVSYQRLYD